MSNKPDETHYEEHIVKYLTSQPIKDANGQPTADMEYREIAAEEYNKEPNKDYCILTSELVAFLKDTQPEEFQKLVDAKSSNEDVAVRNILERIDKEMRTKLNKATAACVKNRTLTPAGTLSILRNQDFDAGCGARFTLLYARPESNKNPEHDLLYRKNRLAIVRQLRYSKVNNNEIDLAIFVNGFPVVTIELKNTLTNQTHHNAIKQYMTTRPVAGEKFLEFKRCLVHFAMGTEQVYMTTKLDGENTRFFPFNKLYSNIGVVSNKDGYRTSYMWEDVLRRDSLLDIIQNFMTLQVSVEKRYDVRKQKFEETVSERLIFPRYHQRRAVNQLIKKVTKQGAGHNYLIQHSAGSGKSNTITWLAFRLSSLYQHPQDLSSLFDSVIVVTDRRVLNEQMRLNIQQFDPTHNLIYAVGQGKDTEGHSSEDLKTAIESRKKIIITTIQMFPYIADSVKMFDDRNYAVIIDEAHSSQSGEDARQMRKALSLEEAEAFDKKIEEVNDEEAKINQIIDDFYTAEAMRKGKKTNVSFFAFTATPKSKTIELFCERENGTKEPFDVYTMEQAIKEGFILDVMRNYMSFKRYFKLVRNKKFDDKEYDKKKAVALLASYVDLQDAAIEKKSRIMIEHFVTQTEKEIDGKARAMLVTRSRLHAVRYKLKFDKIMQEMHLPYSALVAFSGTVRDEETDMEYTEASMNNLPGQISIPQALKMPKFRILIVANKYQTGFDEPNLHTMFVDKKLGGANAVQTLSRLNRTARGKDSTMILDFVNDPDQILADFQFYYGKNKMPEKNETDPNALYDVKAKLRDFGVFSQSDVDEFAKYALMEKADSHKVNKILDEVCDRAIENLDENLQDSLRKTCKQFYNLYTFLSQIVTFADGNLEKLAMFCLSLSKKLPHKKEGLPYDVLTENQLDSYKVQYDSTRTLELETGDMVMEGLKPGESQSPTEPDFDWLSNIIKRLNDTFGIDLTDEDKVDLNNLRNTIIANEDLMSYFNPRNSRDDVKSKFDEEVDMELLNFINTKLELYNKLTEDRVNTLFKNAWFNELYDSRVRRMR